MTNDDRADGPLVAKFGDAHWATLEEVAKFTHLLDEDNRPTETPHHPPLRQRVVDAIRSALHL